jgi:hypothetical protein
MTQNKERVLDLVVMLNDYYQITDICSSVNLEEVCRKLHFCLLFLKRGLGMLRIENK